MTAELLKRLDRVEANTSAILKVLSEAAAEKKPPLTQTELAKRLDVSLWTVNRWVRQGKIRTTANGKRIPYSEFERLSS